MWRSNETQISRNWLDDPWIINWNRIKCLRNNRSSNYDDSWEYTSSQNISQSKTRTQWRNEDEIVQQQQRMWSCNHLSRNFWLFSLYVHLWTFQKRRREREKYCSAYFYATCISWIFLDTRERGECESERTEKNQIIMLFNFGSRLRLFGSSRRSKRRRWWH